MVDDKKTFTELPNWGKLTESYLRKTEKHPSNTQMTNWKAIANIQNVFVKFWKIFRGKLKGTIWKAIANIQNVFVKFWNTFRGKLKGNHEILNYIYEILKSIHQILQWQTERQSQTFKTYSWNFEKHLGESWKAIMKFWITST